MRMVEVNRKKLSVVIKREPIIQDALLVPNSPIKALAEALFISPLLAIASPVLFLDAGSQSGTVLCCDGLYYFF